MEPKPAVPRGPFRASPPRVPTPPDACDCHVHVFGDPALYPLVPNRSYTPSLALVEDARAMMRTLGLSRVVFVQPSGYGDDNRRLLDAMAEFGRGSRGVAVARGDTAGAVLDSMHAAGVRGVRLNLASVGDRGGTALARLCRELGERVARLGWHIEFLVGAELIAELAAVAAALPVDVVIAHMGHIPVASWKAHPATMALIRMLEGGRTWLKLTAPYRLNDDNPDYRAVVPLARTLAMVRPDRMVWGSDWPHTPVHRGRPDPDPTPRPFRGHDTGALLDFLFEAVPDAATRHRILVDNPARLYGFD